MGSFDISYFTSEFYKFVRVNGFIFCKFYHFAVHAAAKEISMT